MSWRAASWVMPECGGEVGGCELRDPRGTGAGERAQVLAVEVGLAPVGR